MQMTRMWTEGLNRFSGPTGTTNPGAPAVDTGENLGVCIQVQSTRPTTVVLDLAAGADAQHLTVGPLCNAGDSRVTLDGVELVSQLGRYSVQLNVSDFQEPGVYVGAVEDAHRGPLGEVTVVITGVAKKRKRASAKQRASRAAPKK